MEHTVFSLYFVYVCVACHCMVMHKGDAWHMCRSGRGHPLRNCGLGHSQDSYPGQTYPSQFGWLHPDPGNMLYLH